MSFSSITLDSPQVVGALSAACFAAFPLVKGTFERESIPWVLVQGVNLCAYGASFWTVTLPARAAASKRDKDEATSVPSQASRASSPKKKPKTPVRRTFMPPDGWGLLILAPIFVGECLMVGTQMAISKDAAMAPLVREIAGPYAFAQIFQGLWTASVRPQFSQGLYKHIAALNFTGMAMSLSFCHRAFTKTEARGTYPRIDFILNFLPLSLHFGWTTVSSLANWNASLSLESSIPPQYLAYLGHASVALATAVGSGIAMLRSAPMYGVSVAWGLSAIASGLTKRLDEAEEEQELDEASKTLLKATELQRNLSLAGAAICTTISIMVGLGVGSKKQTASR